MKIAIDLTPLSYHMTGIERYAACITQKMLIQDKENEYRLIFRNEIHTMFKNFIDGKRVKEYILYGDNKLIFFQVILPWNLYKIKADRYLFFAFTSPVLFIRKGIYNTIHDMGAWEASEAMTLFQKMYWRITMRCAGKVSDGIITVSNFSKNRISSIMNYPLEKIHVVYSAVFEGMLKDYGITFDYVKNRYNLPDKYIMTLSTLEPRKNLELLLAAYSEIQDKVDYDLVLVGRKGWKIDNLLKRYSGAKRIHITGFVADEDVSVIYRNAMCFVFPSSYEGFGLPPVEALALGPPVIASDAASIPEILGNQACYFNNEKLNDLKSKLLEIENKINFLPNSLSLKQKHEYNFAYSAKKIFKIIKGERYEF